MGDKGDQLTNASTTAAEGLRELVTRLGNIRLKKMFGGYGVFEEDTMFALVDKNGQVFLKGDDSNIQTFQDAGSEKHGRMPYYSVPEKIMNDTAALISWAESTLAVARNAK
ncbi:MAG: TfoX/Sxy family protein [Anaerolineales bacterium]|nr:TfoX/Sxy family protein [Anaerolineales bacterium]